MQMVLEKKEGARGQGEKNLGMRTHSALASTGDKAVAIPEVIPYIKTALSYVSCYCLAISLSPLNLKLCLSGFV